MTSEALDEILADLGYDSIAKVVEEEQGMLNDSVMPAYCVRCGRFAGDMEPDVREAKCNGCSEQGVNSILEIILSHY